METTGLFSQNRDIPKGFLYPAAAHVSNHAPYVFGRHFGVPAVKDPRWVDSWNRVIIEQWSAARTTSMEIL